MEILRCLFLFQFILRVGMMNSITVPRCEVNEFLTQVGNTSEYQCVPCRECPNGFREVSQCRKRLDTQCEKCPRGTFYRRTGREKLCRECRKCANDLRCDNSTVQANCVGGCYEFTKTDCSLLKNTVCKLWNMCRLKKFVKKCSRYRNYKCRPCSKCVKGKTFVYRKCRKGKNTLCRPCSSCAPGFYVKRKCTLRHDTLCARCPSGRVDDVICNRCPRGTFMSSTDHSVCEPCPQGTFMDKNNHAFTYCKMCRQCNVHEEIVHACNATDDTRCGSCSPGFFRLSSTHKCALCSQCPNNRTDLVVEECRGQSTNTTRMCRPPLPFEDPPSSHPVVTQTDNNLGGDPGSDKDMELPARTSYTGLPTPLLLIALLIFIIMVCFISAFLNRVRNSSKRNAIRLMEKDKKACVVSMPTLFSTNSITDYFDFNLQYKRSNPKYSSDPDFYKWDIPACCGSVFKDRPLCTLNSKSRSLGTVNTMELDFWNDRSIAGSSKPDKHYS